MLRDRGCVFPGCIHTRFLHHRMVHEGGWKITRGEDGELVFSSPTDQRMDPEPPWEPVGDISTWIEEWAAAHGVEPSPDKNMPHWDGTAPDYVVAVDALLVAG